MSRCSGAVAENALLACQRCCCICHKFCGSKMELHHIRQPGDGGDNSPGNCIPLCFDCHADVTSYNPEHPKGRKYAESEVRIHRDMWFQFCKTNPAHVGSATPPDSSRKIALRPHRLCARNALADFVRLCTGYRTLHPQHRLDKTRQLTDAIDHAKRAVELQGPLSIPGLTDFYAEIMAHAWSLQRLLDRQAGPDPQPISQEYETADDNLDAIENWFGGAQERLKMLFDSHLKLLQSSANGAGAQAHPRRVRNRFGRPVQESSSR